MVVHSSNRAAVRLGQEVGLQTFAALARELGITGYIPRYPSTFLGSFDASLVEMTASFAAFENGGRAIEPHFIRRIVNTEGTTVWSRRGGGPARRVLHGPTADLVLDAMRGVVDEGTGAGVRRHLQGPAAGKTGTSAAGADAWFVGVRPGIAAGVWIGLDQPAAMVEDGGGGLLAVPLWGRWMAALDRLGYGEGEWTPSERLLRVSLGQREEGDSIAYCRGGEGPGRLVPEWVLREMRVCEPTPLEWIQMDTASEDWPSWEPLSIELGPDTSGAGGLLHR
ncbi:MAG: hypothetical protein LC667_20625 [Thioalkalivibrio sp.]|nr:hypothetical protein [Thioalkalivibrio sp.]